MDVINRKAIRMAAELIRIVWGFKVYLVAGEPKSWGKPKGVQKLMHG
jgi:hypothetical protein